MRPYDRIAIIGAGMMGKQIALHVAVHGMRATVLDISQKALDSVHPFLQTVLHGDLELDPEPVLALVETNLFTQAANLSANGLIIESVYEDVRLKGSIFRQLGDECSDSILASNSSAIPVSTIAREAQLTESVQSRLLNMHFLPPIWQRPLVELMGGPRTTQRTIESAKVFAEAVKLTPIVAERENVGFVFNYIWQAIKNASLNLVDRRVTSVEDVDKAWKVAMGMSVGPFEVMDTIGLDVVLAVYNQFDHPAPRTLVDKVNAGELGVKTGKGFYKY